MDSQYHRRPLHTKSQGGNTSGGGGGSSQTRAVVIKQIRTAIQQWSHLRHTKPSPLRAPLARWAERDSAVRDRTRIAPPVCSPSLPAGEGADKLFKSIVSAGHNHGQGGRIRSRSREAGRAWHRFSYRWCGIGFRADEREGKGIGENTLRGSGTQNRRYMHKHYNPAHVYSPPPPRFPTPWRCS